ncbi:MAG: bifunctional adenosylcobinamide kinase/adenosylcobinamide-phosphate guanylyltransferase [Actinobacteria bacterium]|nr:bifunctional adenosylcobinamide kinase/adenosylcobinamide-phosphate guanylyltransferase [Actinomycetota bacterium]MCA1739395.1 bifunctional adenosylcobinamide kinase/adenosylcobinamide-phosphate guanylyltransferase [Actinomycetota bacterium]
MGSRGERAARGGDAECTPENVRRDDVAVRALILGGARSGKSAFAEELALSLGGEGVLYVATALVSSDDLELSRRVELHRERRHPNWGLLELAGGSLEAVVQAANGWGAVLLDSLTLWVSARMLKGDENGTLEEFERFMGLVGCLREPVILVSDEVGLGVAPESAEGRRFRDLLGLVNQRAAAGAEEAYVCIAGISQRIK